MDSCNCQNSGADIIRQTLVGFQAVIHYQSKLCSCANLRHSFQGFYAWCKQENSDILEDTNLARNKNFQETIFQSSAQLTFDETSSSLKPFGPHPALAAANCAIHAAQEDQWDHIARGAAGLRLHAMMCLHHVLVAPA
jgi:hypothetical protein